MTLLFFDTETTGLVRDHEPLDSQPHLVQFAAILTEDDATELASVSIIVRSPVEVPAQAAAIHGISTERANNFGVHPKVALLVFSHLKHLSTAQVAHNLKFDRKIMEALAWRQAKDVVDWENPTCTMELATPICALPPTGPMMRAGRHGNKSPKLSEAYEFFFNEPLVGAHDALVDVRACARIYFHMKEGGML